MLITDGAWESPRRKRCLTGDYQDTFETAENRNETHIKEACTVPVYLEPQPGFSMKLSGHNNEGKPQKVFMPHCAPISGEVWPGRDTGPKPSSPPFPRPGCLECSLQSRKRILRREEGCRGHWRVNGYASSSLASPRPVSTKAVYGKV